MNRIEIAGRWVRNGLRPYIIAEIGQAHEGICADAWGLAHEAAKCGVDAVKWQYHIASEENSERYDYWRSVELQMGDWQALRLACRDWKVGFIMSCFSLRAAHEAKALDVDAWKIPSAPVWPERIAACGNDKPIIISTGMNTWGEIDSMVRQVKEMKAPLAVMQCTSKYPTPMVDVGLSHATGFGAAYSCPSGLSDHTGTIWPSVAAMIQGAALIEVHVCRDKEQDIPDAKSSVTFDQLRQICEAREDIMRLKVSVDKNDMASALHETRVKYGRPAKVGKP